MLPGARERGERKERSRPGRTQAWAKGGFCCRLAFLAVSGRRGCDAEPNPGGGTAEAGGMQIGVCLCSGQPPALPAPSSPVLFAQALGMPITEQRGSSTRRGSRRPPSSLESKRKEMGAVGGNHPWSRSRAEGTHLQQGSCLLGSWGAELNKAGSFRQGRCCTERCYEPVYNGGPDGWKPSTILLWRSVGGINFSRPLFSPSLLWLLALPPFCPELPGLAAGCKTPSACPSLPYLVGRFNELITACMVPGGSGTARCCRPGKCGIRMNRPSRSHV